jgi:ornithine cyclodeaminase
MNPSVFNEATIRSAIAFGSESVDAIEGAFASLSSGNSVMMPPIMQILVDDVNGQTCIKSAYTAGQPYYVIKLASIFGENAKHGLPNSSGLMIICNSQNGLAEAILLDNGYLTALRTQAAGAVAAKHLSRADARIVGMIGAGKQSRLQLHAVASVRKIEKALVWSPLPDECSLFAKQMADYLGIEIVAVSSAEEAVRPVDIVITATPARNPIVRSEWLSPGQHITAMGADAPGKSELYPDVVARATRYVCDRDEQCRSLSELRAAIDAGAVKANFPTIELGDVVTGKRPGRISSADITIVDLVGLGVQDTAIAVLAWKKICESDIP